MLLNRQSHNLRFASWCQACQTNQHNSMPMEALTNHHLSEILIRRQQQCCLLIRQVQDSIIGHAWPQFSYIRNLIPFSPETCDNRAVNALVSYKVHAGASAKGYTTSARRASLAKAKAAKIASRVSCGWASRTCSIVSPAANFSKISSTVIRVPTMTGLPIITLGFDMTHCLCILSSPRLVAPSPK